MTSDAMKPVDAIRQAATHLENDNIMGTPQRALVAPLLAAAQSLAALQSQLDAQAEEIERRTEATIVHRGQALACSMPVSFAYGMLEKRHAEQAEEIERLREYEQRSFEQSQIIVRLTLDLQQAEAERDELLGRC